MTKMGTPLLEIGLMKESRIPDWEKANGPSSFRLIQWCSECTSGGRLSAGQTMESSSAVRVIEGKTHLVAHSGTCASGARRTIAYGPPESQRNLSWWRLSTTK